MFSAVDISPEYGTEIDDKLVKRTSEDFSLFLPSFSGLKAGVVWCSCEENAEDIFVPETDVLGSLAYEGEVVTWTDRKQPIFDEYPSKDDEEQSFSMVPVYDDCDYDPWECHEEEKEELKAQPSSCPAPANKQVSPRINQPTSAFRSPMLSRDIQQYVSSCKTNHAFCYQPNKFYQLISDPVGEYMELHFFQALKPPNFVLPSTLGGELKKVIYLLSQFHYLLSITDRVNEFPVRKLLEWLWWKFTFT